MQTSDFPTAWPRRDFLKISATTILGLALTPLPAMAGPFTREDFEKLVPPDKKLSAEWIKSLFERGEPEVFQGRDLKFIGMPVGGIGAGQIYLGGDGRLWHWDIFNQLLITGADHYAHPIKPSSPLEQSFSLKIGNRTVSLDRDGFSNIRFRGEYPIGVVEYSDTTEPIEVKLEAFSPFIPLNTDDSSLPATILQYTLHNVSTSPVTTTLSGTLENGVCLNHRDRAGQIRNRTIRREGLTTLLCSAEESLPSGREDILFEDWNQAQNSPWKSEDTSNAANSNASTTGETLTAGSDAKRKLISRDFTLERNFILFWLTGGKRRKGSSLTFSLVVNGNSVPMVSNQNASQMDLEYIDVRPYEGRQAHIEILNEGADLPGDVGLGKIIFADQKPDDGPMEKISDHGTMCLGLLGEPADEASPDATAPFPQKLFGSLGRRLSLLPGESATVTFILAWHFPNLSLEKMGCVGRHYSGRFSSADAVACYIADNFFRLEQQTKLWRKTWYDSTLPYWFLDRSFLNTSTLATSTSYRFADGRYYGWEGVCCCPGTCDHVYHYAHACARLFPDLEQHNREHVDFGLALKTDGEIRFRGEFNEIPAVDGQAGTILRALREHQMSADMNFLSRNWPKIKLAMKWLIAKDANGDGLIESNQHNTLDTDWFGKVAWLSGLYLASLAAAAQMGDEVGDSSFAAECRQILDVGRKNLVDQLFEGEYFINRVDPKHLDAINSGTGCEIDQVFGQSWAFQVGLPRIFPEKQTRSALQSIWRYNFAPDVGPYRLQNKPGRWYAMPGEAGLLMCTFPRSDWNFVQASGIGKPGWAAGYFNECMNGFEYQVAGHMIWEGMLMEGLAITRAVHDRYHASHRNPWNEIECGDHYARSMASYGVYLAACGFEYHGPKDHIGFAPRLTPEDFKCAFTAAEGWGSYSQRIENEKFKSVVSMHWGRLKLKTIALQYSVASSAHISLAEKSLGVVLHKINEKILLTLDHPVILSAGQHLEITLT